MTRGSVRTTDTDGGRNVYREFVHSNAARTNYVNMWRGGGGVGWIRQDHGYQGLQKRKIVSFIYEVLLYGTYELIKSVICNIFA